MPELWHQPLALAALGVFVAAYVLVMLEEVIELRKSKPVLLTAGIIWLLAGLSSGQASQGELQEAARNAIADYGQLLLFLLASITYVNVMEERRVFAVFAQRLMAFQFSYRSLFWVLGACSFALSAVLANLTTAMVLGAVAIGLGRGNSKFVTLACINIVVASNAGGAFCPFGDVTSLMIWQAGKLGFWPFFKLFVPAVVNWLVPAFLMSFAIPGGKPSSEAEGVSLKPGAWGVVGLFGLSVVLTAWMSDSLGLAPMFGMVLGLGLLQAFAFYLQRRGHQSGQTDMVLDSFAQMQRVDWDTLLFFGGILLSLAGLSHFGWLRLLQTGVYDQLGLIAANTLAGVVSAILDNVPVVYAVLQMNPAMDQTQWLLLTLAAGTGGSILSVGSAAGITLMGQARHDYTFLKHLKWAPTIGLGYVAAIGVHLALN